MTDDDYARSLSGLIDTLTALCQAERDYATFDVLHDMREDAVRMLDTHEREMERSKAA